MTGRPSILYESMSNFVRAIGNDGRQIVVKRYLSRGRRNGFWLPMGRMVVEWIVLQHLHRIASRHGNLVVAPRSLGLDYQRAQLRMSYLHATPLPQCDPTFWPPPAAWAALGRIKALLERSSETVIGGAEVAIWQAQQRLRKEALDFRLQDVTPTQALLRRECEPDVRTRPGVVCLGDLTLPNLLVCDERLGLIDFEFAHIGPPGSDVGRLLAILQTRAAQRPAERERLGLFWRQLLAGYEEAGGDTRCAEIFAALYVCYYQHPGYAGPNVPASGT